MAACGISGIKPYFNPVRNIVALREAFPGGAGPPLGKWTGDAIVDGVAAPDVGRRTSLDGVVQPALRSSAALAPAIPDSLMDTYYWAYLNPRNVRLLDREIVVSCILWGYHRRLRREAFRELRPGQNVLQPACVYGDFSPALARHLGPRGRLEVIDVAPIQVAGCRRKLRGLPQAHVRLADAAAPGGGPYDAVCCYFLLHELPEDYKRAVVDALLMSVVPGGKVVFMDYHRPHWAHPLKGVMSLVFDALEPYAKSLWRHEIADIAGAAEGFTWRKETYFGGLYQKTVARRRGAALSAFR